MPSVDFSLPLPQLLFLLGLGLAFLGLIGAKGTIREIALTSVDREPLRGGWLRGGAGAGGYAIPEVVSAAGRGGDLPAAMPTLVAAAVDDPTDTACRGAHDPTGTGRGADRNTDPRGSGCVG